MAKWRWGQRDGRTLFMALDQNKDGAVSREEIAGGLHRLGIQMDTTRAETLMEEIPLDTSGSLPHGSVYAHRCGTLVCASVGGTMGVTGCCGWSGIGRSSCAQARSRAADPGATDDHPLHTTSNAPHSHSCAVGWPSAEPMNLPAVHHV